MATASRKAVRSRRDAESWEIWADHLVLRQRPLAIVALLPGKCWPPAWSTPTPAGHSAEPALLTAIERSSSNRRMPGTDMEALLRQWLDSAAPAIGQSPSPADMNLRALQAIAWCHALPKLANAISSTSWWDLFEELLRLAGNTPPTVLKRDPLMHQLLAGELRLTLAYLLPEMPSCRKLSAPARRALSAGLTSLLHGEGVLPAQYLDLLGPLLACWTRAAALGQQIDGGCFTEAARQQYDRFVRNALRLRRADGMPAFSHASATRSMDELFAAALRLGGDDPNRRIAAAMQKPAPGKTKKSSRAAALPGAPLHLESAAMAVLRPNWSKSREWLAVAYPDQSLRVELNVGATVVCSGCWEFEIQRDGRPAQPAGKWEEVCWVSDDEGCYLELELRLGEGLRLQRQFLLAAKDRFLYLGDAILGRRRGKLTYRSCLPLARDIAWRGQKESREGFLQGPNCRVLGLPLALPEWRAETGRGDLQSTSRGLELCQAGEGTSMLAPLFFDFDPRRNARPLTWRQLTVAENRAVARSDAAAGYRVMIGGRQWLIYRALARKANRTLLGHNLSSETMIGRFTEKGKVEPVVEIE